MKKVLFTLIAIASVSATQSCKKMCDHNRNQAPKLQTVDAAINENTSYTYTLPPGTNFQVTTPATHATSSQLVVDGATGSFVYQYTPVTNYVGTDVVVLSTNPQPGSANCIHPTNGKPNPNPNGGPCNGQPEIITINLTINNSISADAAKTSNTSSGTSH